MSKPYLIAAVCLALFVRWLAVGQVTVTVAGAPVTVPALALAAVAVIAAAGAMAALVVYRVRAERAMVAAWQARRAAAR
jgi:hypothetical protein